MIQSILRKLVDAHKGGDDAKVGAYVELVDDYLEEQKPNGEVKVKPIQPLSVSEYAKALDDSYSDERTISDPDAIDRIHEAEEEPEEKTVIEKHFEPAGEAINPAGPGEAERAKRFARQMRSKKGAFEFE